MLSDPAMLLAMIALWHQARSVYYNIMQCTTLSVNNGSSRRPADTQTDYYGIR
ncbi:MAG: hypothetical protein DELT_02849 [Desulfovibrio sp.]